MVNRSPPARLSRASTARPTRLPPWPAPRVDLLKESLSRLSLVDDRERSLRALEPTHPYPARRTRRDPLRQLAGRPAAQAQPPFGIGGEPQAREEGLAPQRGPVGRRLFLPWPRRPPALAGAGPRCRASCPSSAPKWTTSSTPPADRYDMAPTSRPAPSRSTAARMARPAARSATAWWTAWASGLTDER